MDADRSLMKLPPLVHNPAGLASIVKKKTVEKSKGRAKPLPLGEARRLSIDRQLSRDHLDALREEIHAAEPVLHNIYEDMEMFAAREGGLNSIAYALFRMRDALDKYPLFEARKKAIQGEIDRLLQDIDLVIAQSRHHAAPLLEPMSKVSPLSTRPDGAQANGADIVFIISRSPGMRRDVKLLANHVADLYNELRNLGVDARFGLMTYGRTPLPAGRMRRTPEEFLEDLYQISFTAESGNTLTAVQGAIDDFTLKPPPGRHFILLADSEAHDDFADMRELTAARLTEEKITFHALSVFDHFTGAPLTVYDRLARSTGGAFYNIDRADYRVIMSAIAANIAHLAVEDGAAVVSSETRIIPVGPSHNDIISVKFPDFRPAALGILNLKLESAEDFRIACMIVDRALSTVSLDRIEKKVLQDHLARILNHFDESRGYRLDFDV